MSEQGRNIPFKCLYTPYRKPQGVILFFLWPGMRLNTVEGALLYQVDTTTPHAIGVDTTPIAHHEEPPRVRHFETQKCYCITGVRSRRRSIMRYHQRRQHRDSSENSRPPRF